MGFLRSLWSGSVDPVVSAAIAGPRFAVDADSIDPAVFGLQSYVSPTSPAPRIDRRSAIQVPAVKRSRDLIAGSLGGLPLDLFSSQREATRWPLFEQPEKNVPRSVTMTRLVEDLFFEQIAWWRVTEFGWHGYPTKVKRVDPRRVTVNEDSGQVYVDGKAVADSDLIRFDSANDALLVAGARAVRTCLALDAAAQRYADEPMPLGYFSPADDADPDDDDEIVKILDGWKAARQTRATGYVPAALKYNSVQFTPEQLQLADARQHAVLEIARVAGIDPEELGVSTTSRTYANQFDRRKAFLDFTLGGYRNAIEDRLSMGDVSPGGYYARLNLDAFLRSDTKSRFEAYEIGLRVGAISQPEIRELEDKPPLTAAPSPQEAPVAAQDIESSFESDELVAHRLDSPQDAASFEVDAEKRVIRGLCVPYGQPARSNGQLFQFSKGSLKYADVSRVKLWIQHDRTQAVGVAFELDDRDDGLYGAFKVARGAEGNRALSLAEDGVLDGLSIGLGHGGKYRLVQGVNHATEVPLMETSLTPCPSFDDARVHAVAASADTEGSNMTTTDPAEVTAEPQDFSAVTDAITKGFEGLQFPQRETVEAGGTVEVNEALPYRFDGAPGEHSFSEDLRAMASGNAEATQRLETFMEEAFAVTTTNTGALNPTQNRPELYVPNLEFTRPLFSLVSTGVISDKTPFTVPKFSSATGLVGDHTEGTEPTPGAFSATSQTITPTAISGKVEINREVWDQGGSPQADSIIWREMLNGYYEALEAKIAARLNGLSLTEINLASATDNALVNAVEAIFVDLQYVRGGNRYSALALDGKLFKALVSATDAGGRKLLPILSPSNADGQVTSNFSAVAIGSQRGVAAWALGAANDSNSYLFVPSSVWMWASAPKRFTFEYQVKSVDMAIWGYQASAVLRDTDVKRIDYTTSDTP